MKPAAEARPCAPSSPQEGELIEAAEKLSEAVREFSHDVKEIQSIFSGPIPPPNFLRAYNQAVPGLAERIVTMAEKEGDHRRNMERRALDAEIETNKLVVQSYAWEVRRGQVFALMIGVTAILSGLFAALNAAEIAGTFIGAGGVLGLVAVFIRGRTNPFVAENDAATPTRPGADAHDAAGDRK